MAHVILYGPHVQLSHLELGSSHAHVVLPAGGGGLSPPPPLLPQAVEARTVNPKTTIPTARVVRFIADSFCCHSVNRLAVSNGERPHPTTPVSLRLCHKRMSPIDRWRGRSHPFERSSLPPRFERRLWRGGRLVPAVALDPAAAPVSLEGAA